MEKMPISELFYRPWNKEQDDFFPCQHCHCRHEVGAEWECPYSESLLGMDEPIGFNPLFPLGGEQNRDARTDRRCSNEIGFDDMVYQKDQTDDLVYIDNNLINPIWLLTKGFGLPRGKTYRKGEAEYRDGILSYIPLPGMAFPLISFEVKEGPRFVPQFYLRVRTDDIISAYDFAEEIGEIPVLEDIFFDFYEAVFRCAGLRHTNLVFGWIIRDFADVVIPVFGKIFRQGGLTYIDMKNAPICKEEIDDYLGGYHSGEDGDFHQTESTCYLDGGWGFDFIENGECTDYIPICDLIEGEVQCGLLIDGYWLQDGMDYCVPKVLHLFTVILDWITDLWSTATALTVANALVREVPVLEDLVAYLKDALAQEIRSWDEE